MKTMHRFLPGPVEMFPDVGETFHTQIVSHRSLEFKDDFEQLKHQLCTLTKSNKVYLISGSGTLANDMIAAQLKSFKGLGLILSNGEFGHRLIQQAQRFNLSFFTYVKTPGEEFNIEEIKSKIQSFPDISWIWFVHSETSTGILNNLKMITDIGKECNAKVCVDIMSSIGNVPIDLSQVYLASASSNKGLACFPGLAIVFHNGPNIEPDVSIPTYLDLGYLNLNEGIPFTISTNLIYALTRSLRNIDASHYERVAVLSSFFHKNISSEKYKIIGYGLNTNPAVCTIGLADGIDSVFLGKELLKRKFYVAFESSYLIKMNWIQVCFMGNHHLQEIELLVNEMNKEILPPIMLSQKILQECSTPTSK